MKKTPCIKLGRLDIQSPFCHMEAAVWKFEPEELENGIAFAISELPNP